MRKGLFLVIILLFPSIIYMFFSLGEHHVKRLGYYGSYDVNDAGDTVYRAISIPQLIDDQGKTLDSQKLSGQVVVVDLFTYPCEDQCAKHFTTLANYLNDVAEKEKWTLISICLTPDINTDQMRELRSKLIYEGDNWRLAAFQDSASIEEFLTTVFVDTKRVTSTNELPSSEFVLIDQQGRIREFFNSKIYNENKKMEDAIKLVIKEPFMPWKPEK